MSTTSTPVLRRTRFADGSGEYITGEKVPVVHVDTGSGLQDLALVVTWHRDSEPPPASTVRLRHSPNRTQAFRTGRWVQRGWARSKRLPTRVVPTTAFRQREDVVLPRTGDHRLLVEVRAPSRSIRNHQVAIPRTSRCILTFLPAWTEKAQTGRGGSSWPPNE